MVTLLVDTRVDVSVVIVHWNVPEMLGRCLASLVRERANCDLIVEIIVVDTASPDKRFRDVVDGYAHVLCIEMDTNKGYAAGCNAGIGAATGASILLLNADVEMDPGSIGMLRQALHVAVHVGLVAPLLLNADGSIQSAGYRFPGIMNVIADLVPLPGRLTESPLNGRVPVGDGAQPIKVDYALGAALMARRDAITDVGLMDEDYGMYCEEIDWAHQLARRGWTMLLVPSARVVHFGGQSTSQRPDAMREALWSSRARYYGKWGTTREKMIINWAVQLALRLDDRRAVKQRRASNARIRTRFAVLIRQRTC